jgi:2-amino-4-hydroxy-6-hydroxymethyldihydropteridine diphosphokinase
VRNERRTTRECGGSERPGGERGKHSERGVAVVLALGSNLGDRLDILQGGVDAIAGIPEVQVMTVSPVYETVPVGGPPQPDYLNAVLLARTTLPTRTLLDRVREVRWGPRTLDIDIITAEGERSDDPVLTLPHPRAHERAFVLAPWHDADPDAELPGHGSVAALLAAVGVGGIRRSAARLRLPGPSSPPPPTASQPSSPAPDGPAGPAAGTERA